MRIANWNQGSPGNKARSQNDAKKLGSLVFLPHKKEGFEYQTWNVLLKLVGKQERIRTGD